MRSLGRLHMLAATAALVYFTGAAVVFAAEATPTPVSVVNTAPITVTVDNADQIAVALSADQVSEIASAIASANRANQTDPGAAQHVIVSAIGGWGSEVVNVIVELIALVAGALLCYLVIDLRRGHS